MTNVIIIGHGGYGTSVKRILAMLLGEIENFIYIDFNEQDGIEVLKRKINDAVARVGENDVLFCCDVAGGTPFREAAVVCSERKNFCCVAGINISAYAEISLNLQLGAAKLAETAISVTKDTVICFNGQKIADN